MHRKLVLTLAVGTLFCLATGSIQAADVIPLAGGWRFALDRDDAGIKAQWFDTDLPDKIRLPGVLEAQGYGDPIGIQTPWVLTLYDRFWYLRADYAADTNAGRVKVPFLCQPPRHYLGAAWYQRDIEIPQDWKDKRVVLFLERPHWKTTAWLDGREIGTNLSLCTPHEYDFGQVAPGRHRLTLRVDNRMILPYRPDAHSVSDSLTAAWNGIVGKIELQASDPVCLERLRLDPDLEHKGVAVTLYLHNGTGKPARAPLVRLQVVPENFGGSALKPLQQSAVVAPGDTNLTLFFPMGNHFEMWSEFNPKCYELRATIGGQGFHSEIAGAFGMREFKTDGNQFILNGHPIYLRGTHDGGDFPLTGYPPTDVTAWQKIFQTCKDYGLNHMRFHSWCPPEAAFEAADELGFYLQVECGMWNSFTPGGAMEKQLYAETGRILRAYGNHPSLMLISASNEAHGDWKPVLSRWVEHFRTVDPRHLYTPDTGWSLVDSPGEPINGGADYLAVARIGSHDVRGVRGWFGNNFSNSVAGVNVPVVAHEVGQWCAYPDYGIIKKFTGFMRPGNYEIFRDSLAAHGMRDLDQDFARASGRFQLECYKEEIEANLRTPGLDGFQLLDLHDYVGQGTALVGVLDTFWDSKGYATPQEFRRFCNTVVPLARLTKRTFTTAEVLDVPVEIANFSAGPLANATPAWKIVDLSGTRYAAGKWPARTISPGKNIDLGQISVDLSKLPAPRQYQLVVQVGENAISFPSSRFFQNDWNFWLYPAQVSDSIPTNILVTSSWDEAAARLSADGRVLFLPPPADLDWSSPPLAAVPIFWNRLMGPGWSRMLGLWCETNSPALAEFPTEPNCDWQWTEILRHARAVNLDHLPRQLQPMVQAIDDWNRNWKLGVVFDCNVGAGKLMFCTVDLEHDLARRPVARQLRRSLLDYMAGSGFHPRTTLSLDEFRSLYFDSRIMRKLGATAQAEGVNAGAAIDADPNTCWLLGESRRGEPPPAFPHELTIHFPSPVPMDGLVLMSRQNDRNHSGDTRACKIEIADDHEPWQEIASVELVSTWNPQTIHFAKTVTATRLRFVALSDFGTDHSTALAELAVIYARPKPADTGSGEVHYRNVPAATPEMDEGINASHRPSKSPQ
ncbi:MAG TPA: discoidin domain-containing protein [Verrucomicrobiae bacterium]|nr:discoidin domain-containing protein [Verrucomicrobiae bacterium]